MQELADLGMTGAAAAADSAAAKHHTRASGGPSGRLTPDFSQLDPTFDLLGDAHGDSGLHGLYDPLQTSGGHLLRGLSGREPFVGAGGGAESGGAAAAPRSAGLTMSDDGDSSESSGSGKPSRKRKKPLAPPESTWGSKWGWVQGREEWQVRPGGCIGFITFKRSLTLYLLASFPLALCLSLSFSFALSFFIFLSPGSLSLSFSLLFLPPSLRASLPTFSTSGPMMSGRGSPSVYSDDGQSPHPQDVFPSSRVRISWTVRSSSHRH